MSNDVVIRVENLSKRYRIGAKEEGYKTFREAIIDGITAPIRNFKRLRKLTKFDNNPSIEHRAKSIESKTMPSAPCSTQSVGDAKPYAPGSMQAQNDDIIWALRDVSFEVKQGEIVGIIGRNGAGKSTLLKILSRITEPTSGDVKLYGRVSSLLEVGTGFHPELTGRENIFLNGAILGMSKTEIKKKFDEIVAFAEVEKFIDTPVKRYSSGMYVRLAFAVAAHLEPEILLVDEVLAVGDAQFQKKCLGKMGEVAKEGRTVFFVSHNISAIENLCQRTILLAEGKIEKDGQTRSIVRKYLSIFASDEPSIDLEQNKDRSGTGEACFIRVQILNSDNQPCSTVSMGGSLTIRFCIRSNSYRKSAVLGMYLYTENGTIVADFRTTHTKFDAKIDAEIVSFDLVIDPVYLYPQTYLICPWIVDSSFTRDIDYVNYAAKFTVEQSDFLGTGTRFDISRGIFYMPSYWKKTEFHEEQ